VRVLITGAGGQVGRALVETAPDIEVLAYRRGELDIRDGGAVRARVGSDRPSVVINTAAFTAVDLAETEPEAASASNAAAVEHLADAVAEAGARLIHLSTDFVFDGAATEPYRPDDPPNPVSAYGRTKRAGEVAALDGGGTVVRTSRVYARHGTNFVLTMLELMRTRDEVQVVADQVGAPTWARSVAGALWAIAHQGGTAGVWHWTDGGSCTWYDWAVAIQEGALARGLLDREVPIRPVSTDEFPTPAKRPTYSVLDCTTTAERFGLQQVPWVASLHSMLDIMTAETQ